MISARGLESATDAAVLTTTIAMQPLLSPDDLADGLPPAKVAALDRAVRGSRGGTEIARIKIWHSDGDLIYVADPHTRSPAATGSETSHELAEALEGEIEAEIISSGRRAGQRGADRPVRHAARGLRADLVRRRREAGGRLRAVPALPAGAGQHPRRHDPGDRAAVRRPGRPLARPVPHRGDGIPPAAAGGRPQRAPGAARRSDRAGQPRAARRGAGGRRGERAPLGRAGAAGPGPVPRGQRHPRPRPRRRAGAGDGRPPDRARRAGRPGGQARR